jgi:hypothetical protein
MDGMDRMDAMGDGQNGRARRRLGLEVDRQPLMW